MDKKYISILAFLLILSSILMVSATVTLSNPVASQQITGSAVLFNATNSSNFDQMENCTFYGASVNTANSSITALAVTALNTSVANHTIMIGVDSTKLEDGNAYNVFASCWNVTAFQENSTNITVIVDNSVPTAPSSLSPVANSVDEDGTINFSATVTNSETTACTLWFPNKLPASTSSYSMSYTGSSCYYNIASILDESYDYIIQATDGLNTTNSTTTRFNVNIPTSSGFLFQDVDTDLPSASSTSKILGMNPGIFWIVLIVLILASIAYFRK